MNADINIGENIFRCGESEFTEGWNTVVSALCLHKNETIISGIVVVIFHFLKIVKMREAL